MASTNLTFLKRVPHAKRDLSIPSIFPERSERSETMAHGFRLVLAAMLCSLGTATYADLPLTIEDLITDKGDVKLDLSLSYTNNEEDSLRSVPIGQSTYIWVPSQDNSDILVGSLSLAYGLTRNTEIYGRSSYLYSHARTSRHDETGTAEDNRLLDAWVGVNYRFKEDDATPALLGFAETAALDEYQGTLNYFKSWAVGFTTYRAVDPIVFSLTAGYRLDQTRKSGDHDFPSGNSLFLSPAVDFAVNDRVTLTTGWRWMRQQADRSAAQRNPRTSADLRPDVCTSTELRLGVSYGVSEDDVIQSTFTANTSGNGGSSLWFNWRHTF